MKTLLLTALLLSPSAHAGKKDRAKAGAAYDTTPASMTVSPPANVFLRNSFDTDPSRYIGRFLVDGQSTLDESNSAKTRCSTFVRNEVIGAGGSVHDELFRVSDSAAASLGFPPIAGVSASREQVRMARIRYTATAKMVSDIDDPAAFEACCKEAGDQCTERYVGEFIQGEKGQIFYAMGTEAELKGGAMASGAMGEIEVKHSMVWRRGIEFESPVYFAFKTMNTGFSGASGAAGCGDWVKQPPRSTQGMYFVGVSEWLDSERLAREAAMIDGRTQAVRWLAESISTGSTEVSGYQGSVDSLRAKLENARFLETSAAGIASMVKDENWCVESAVTPGGGKVKVKVLAFIPKSQYTAAAATLAP